MAISIRAVTTIAEYHACEVLQRRTWAMPDDLEVVPLHMLLTVHRQGGLLLGAFDGDELAGLVFGFLGLTDEGKIKHSSHMMGILPEYQSAGIGQQLKLAQREFVLAQGLDLVTWTYDPLESRNAYLNIYKLGAVCQTYIRDLYGPLTDGLNAGQPSDRFNLDWWVGSEWVQRRLSEQSSPVLAQPPIPVNATERNAAGLLTPGVLTLDVDAQTVQVEIPADYQAIKAADAGLALAWRLAMREAFEAYFAVGYTIVDFFSRTTGSGRRSYYVLQKDWQRDSPISPGSCS